MMTERLLTMAIAGGFSLWFLLSILYQVRPFAGKIGRFDRLGLLPRWTFFAPNPGIYDHHIIYRECDPAVRPETLDSGCGEGLSGWRQLEGLCNGGNVPLVWNPQRRVTKTITDVVNALMTARRIFQDRPNLIQFTLEYFLLLHLVQRHVREGAFCQFAVVRSHGFSGDRTPGIVFLSNFHRVAP
jgi:hypothetical protein